MIDIPIANDYLDVKLNLGLDSVINLTESEMSLLQEYKELRRQTSK